VIGQLNEGFFSTQKRDFFSPLGKTRSENNSLLPNRRLGDTRALHATVL
jgi:hypothetical protein